MKNIKITDSTGTVQIFNNVNNLVVRDVDDAQAVFIESDEIEA